MVRIERGIPVHGKEITEAVNPLEAGLSTLVSFTKGCYIGQEVVARLDTYGKVRRKLCGLVFPDDSPNVPVGRLFFSGEEVGWTTSHTYSTQLNKVIALGYVKGINTSEFVELKQPDGGNAIALRVVDLPFPDTDTNALTNK